MTFSGNATRRILAAVALPLIFGASAAFAVLPPSKPVLPDFDRRSESPAVTSNHSFGLAALKARLPDARVDFDSLLDSPTWVTASYGFLSGPNGSGLAISPESAVRFSANDPHLATKAFLTEHQALFGHGAGVLDAAAIKRDFVTPHNGLHTVIWEQQVNGIPVFEGLLISHTTKRGELVAISSHFLPAPESAADASTPNRSSLVSNPAISSRQAIVAAAQIIEEKLDTANLNAFAPAHGPDKRQSFTAPTLKGNADAHLVWLPLNRNSLRLCWEVVLMSRSRGEMFRVLIDAQTGAALLRQCLTEFISNASYRVFTTQSPTPFLIGFPSPGGAPTDSGYATPVTNQPPLASRTLIVTNAFDTNASPNGWIDDTNNETFGNNVDAHLDRNADDLPDLPRPRGSPFRVFDPPLDLTQDPLTYGDACVVNLFYWCNWMHDRLYSLGFTESAGNFQVNNFGRGGSGNDPVMADAQDGSGYNNANFSTPPDGASGRMQLYLWNGPAPLRDGDFDTEVILHEYTHGLSNRRVGGGVGISALQSRGLGEGWSDFYSLALLSQPADNLNTTYPEGPYVSYLLSGPGLTQGLTQNYYFGIRRYPYSTDMSKNPETFADIVSGVSHHAGIPLNPAIPDVASEIHNQGEIWCSALWDARANLINRYGFAAGNQLILQLVTDGMNLTPANPTFLQARDGILQADLIDSGGVNYHDLWLAFAKRGMGYSAIAPPSSSTSGVTEAFDIPDNLIVTPLNDLNASGPLYGQLLPSSQTYALHNTGTNTMNWTATATVPWVTLSATNGSLAAMGSFTNVLVSLNSTASNTPIGSYTGTITFSNLASGASQPRNLSLNISPPRIYFVSLDADPGWPRQGEWAFGKPSGQGGTAHGNPDPSGGATGTNVFGLNLNGDYSTVAGGPYYLTTGPFNFTGSTNVSLQFQRWLNFDVPPYASATIDVSNDGTNWNVLFANNAGEITDSSWTKTAYDISQVADNHSAVYVRWGYQVFSGAFAYSGWNIDDIEFLGLSELSISLPISATEGDGLLAAQGHIFLAHPTPANITVNLSSSDSSRLTVPTGIIIPAGQTNASFDLTVIDNSVLDGTAVITITANAPGFSTGLGVMSVFDNEVASLALSLPPSGTEGDPPVQGIVTINSPPGDNIFVTLTSSDPTSLQVPSTVFIPSGQTNASFLAFIINDTRINGDRPVTVTAHVANWTNGIASMTIHDNESTNLLLVLPAQLRENNGLLSGAGMVQIAGTLTNNLIVSLVSSNTDKLVVPATATIPAGQTSAQFDLTAISGNSPQSPVFVSVSATATGFAGASGSVNVIDNQTPPAPFNPSPADLSTTNPVYVTLSWLPGLGEGIEKTTNGGFELGILAGWITAPGTNSAFIINDGTIFPPSSDSPTPPFAGLFFASAEQSPPAISVLYQDIFLPTNSGTVTLSWVDSIRNFYFEFDTNQQFHVDVRDTNDVTLATLFSTKPGDPLYAAWVQRTADLSAYTGQTVRIAFIVNAGFSFLDVHLDEISVRCVNLPPITYDIYFGTNPVPASPQLLGSTTNTSWPLPKLTPLANYYWQIVARRLNQTPGPVWQFNSLPTATISNISVVEGNSGTTNAVFTVNLSDAGSNTLYVDFATADGTAIAPGDYTSTNGTLAFAPGQTNQTIIVTVNGDTTVEPNKTFSVSLFNPINLALATNQATATIINDDTAPPVIGPIQISAGQVTLTWSSSPGRSYRVQFCSSLAATWNDLPGGDVTAAGPATSKVDSSGLVTQRFYRVVLLP